MDKLMQRGEQMESGPLDWNVVSLEPIFWIWGVTIKHFVGIMFIFF